MGEKIKFSFLLPLYDSSQLALNANFENGAVKIESFIFTLS